ncbi:branched-chain amino acid ABC transporter permease [Natrarchaeobius halalkaliphilus]|uniref:Branched-chain amino acid ABC transporter permease n=1 Tax=Natrarchaeobius halalkaliphilus TaxID=1679091 RepID=A0A3N6LXE4_9EURY|nr:branched-chain amino acid ABC transporter permease [Natrarchaeobius halalkaliphilus]RQG86711.1 branched-chain amino acid ABC transporter permease [Natrarchaeobius halalkaliphilus]
MNQIQEFVKSVMNQVQPYSKELIIISALISAVLPFIVTSSTLFDLKIMLIFAILAFAVILPIGYTGQLILSQGAFFGIGAYSFVLLVSRGVPSIVGVVVAVTLTALVAYLLGKPATRAHGIYLGIITLAFNMLFVIALEIFSNVTGGNVGLTSPDLLPEVVTGALPEDVLLYYIVLVTYIGVFLFFSRILDSEIGSAFLAIKEDTVVAESIGIDSHRYRLHSFTLSGAVCGLAGGLFAPVNGFVSPPVFDLDTTIEIILAGVAGGLSIPFGSIFGASIVVLLPEYLRAIEQYRLIVYGVLIILILAYLPQGVGGWLQEQWRNK